MLKQLPSVASVYAQPPVQLRAGAVVGSNKLSLEVLWGGECERVGCHQGKEHERVNDCDVYGTWGGVGLRYFVWKIVSGSVFQSDKGSGIGEAEAA